MNRRQRIPVFAAALATATLIVVAASTFDPDAQPIGYVGMPAVTGHDVTSGNEVLFAIDYTPGDWSGNLHAYALSSAGEIAQMDNWVGGAAGQLDLADWNSGRKIVTRSGGAGVPFRWGSLSNTDKAQIDSSTSVSASSSPMLDYLRGDRSNEAPSGRDWRARTHVLGDIVHSTPVYWNEGGVGTVAVGANDGMLHVFDAETGRERFAYIPSMLLGRLPALAATPYTHRYYVDGLLDVRHIASTTYLVGGLGAGGKGLYALDVTSPVPADEAAAASAILWEVTPASSGFANLGYTYSQPRLTVLNDGTAAVVVGNGYNNGGNGHAVLYLINAATGVRIAEIDTGSGSSGSPNGLSSPTLVDTNVDGKADLAYAGDIDGNLWKFDLVARTATRLHATSPAQAITMAPGVREHPYGGYMVNFVTGRMLTDSDKSDTAVHYAYGIWDGAPAANDTLLQQTLTESSYDGVTPAIRVRTATAQVPDWSAGVGHHKGWRTALPVGGERVVGDGAYDTSGVFLFMSTNPAVSVSATPPGENWWMQLNALTGGDNGTIRFDLSGDNAFSSADLLSNGAIPVGRHMGGGVRSQLIALGASGLDVYQANYDRNGEVTVNTDDRGVSGGHFDFDNYFYDTGRTVYTPTSSSTTRTLCARTTDVDAEYFDNTEAPSTSICTTRNGFGSGQTLLTSYSTGRSCGNKKNSQTITCSAYTSSTVAGDYFREKHVHEYDDIYDVTGVNMLNASDATFNLSPDVFPHATDTTPEFKVLVMNQYLNPAAKISVGGNAEESVRTYGSLASQTNAATLLAGLPVYSRATLGTLVLNLPLDAFESRDWWGDGSAVRAGLIPTKYSCVYSVNADGSMVNDTRRLRGLVGPNGERFDGALTVQIIRSSTPASALEKNNTATGDVRFGWRVKQANFRTYVIAEYTMYWHHPNELCYGQSGWRQDAPQDFVSDAVPSDPAAGSNDPKDGVFGAQGGNSSSGGGGTSSGGSSGGNSSSGGSGGGSSGGSGGSTGIVTGGSVSLGGGITGGVTTPVEAQGRVNWRELRP